jgi:hypothetical protein
MEDRRISSVNLPRGLSHRIGAVRSKPCCEGVAHGDRGPRPRRPRASSPCVNLLW